MGIYATVLVERFVENGVINWTLFYSATLMFYVMSAVLFWWFLHLRWMVAFVSLWLEKEAGSKWESDAQKFSAYSPTSHMSSVFFVVVPSPLAFEVAIRAHGITDYHQLARTISIVPRLFHGFELVSGVLLLFLIWLKGMKFRTDHRVELSKQWDTILMRA